jgi:hypothetical protein
MEVATDAMIEAGLTMEEIMEAAKT